VLDICYWISKTRPRDVRWEKVERIRRILTAGTYSVPPKRVAAKLLERMMERDRANQRWKHNRSHKTKDNPGVSEAPFAGKSNKRFAAQRAKSSEANNHQR
jgi:Anti-sigma-28 factor, FlgM